MTETSAAFQDETVQVANQWTVGSLGAKEDEVQEKVVDDVKTMVGSQQLTPKVAQYLQAVYDVSEFPEEYVKYRLHLATGLEVKDINQWFEERRQEKANANRNESAANEDATAQNSTDQTAPVFAPAGAQASGATRNPYAADAQGHPSSHGFNGTINQGPSYQPPTQTAPQMAAASAAAAMMWPPTHSIPTPQPVTSMAPMPSFADSHRPMSRTSSHLALSTPAVPLSAGLPSRTLQQPQPPQDLLWGAAPTTSAGTIPSTSQAIPLVDAMPQPSKVAPPQPDSQSEGKFCEADLETIGKLIGLQTIMSSHPFNGSHQLYLFEQLTYLDSLWPETGSKRRRTRHQHFWRSSDKFDVDDRAYVEAKVVKPALEGTAAVMPRMHIEQRERNNVWTVCLTPRGVVSYLNKKISPLGVRLFRALLAQKTESGGGGAVAPGLSWTYSDAALDASDSIAADGGAAGSGAMGLNSGAAAGSSGGRNEFGGMAGNDTLQPEANRNDNGKRPRS